VERPSFERPPRDSPSIDEPSNKPFRYLSRRKEPLTTAVAFKCREGIVFASDSQGTNETTGTKEFDFAKIYPIPSPSENADRRVIFTPRPTISVPPNRFAVVPAPTPLPAKPSFALAFAGDEYELTTVVEELDEKFANRVFATRKDLKEELEKSLFALHKKYNSDRSTALGFARTQMFLSPQLLFGAKVQEADGRTSFELFELLVTGFAIPIKRYRSIGSGARFADFVLNNHVSKALKVTKTRWSDVDLDSAIKIATATVAEAKSTDLASSGQTKVAVIDRNGFEELKPTEVSAHIEEYRRVLSEALGKALDISSEDMRELFSED
jgi:20S proteasome alpha/beta subunit